VMYINIATIYKVIIKNLSVCYKVETHNRNSGFNQS